MSKRRINFILAPPLVLGGLFFIMLPFGFATMWHRDPAAPQRWGPYLGRVFQGGLSSFALGVPLFALGIYIGAAGAADSE